MNRCHVIQGVTSDGFFRNGFRMKRHLIQAASVLCLLLAPALLGMGASAQQRAPAAAPGSSGASNSGPGNAALGNLGTDSKEPIKIDADKLDVLDKESKAIFSGNVVAVQGKTTIKCARMTILYDNRGQGPAAQGAAGASRPATVPRPAPAASGQAADGGIKRLDCDGPVTVTSEDQVATSQRAVFDREKDQVVMTGGVALAKGPNVQRGERLVYNTKTGIANFDGGEIGGRVQGFFVPGSADPPPAATGPARRPAPPARATPPTN